MSARGRKKIDPGPFPSSLEWTLQGEYLTSSEEETFRLGEELGARFAGKEVVLLSGELGAGKTVFAKGIALGAGVADTGCVCSPSFTLINVYQGRHTVYHIDLYRLENPDEIEDLGWEDYLGEGIVIIEWAERLPFELDGILVEIEVGADDKRRILISGA